MQPLNTTVEQLQETLASLEKERDVFVKKLQMAEDRVIVLDRKISALKKQIEDAVHPATPAPEKRAESTVVGAHKPKASLIRRVPGIDGLRGLAVLTVVIYHFLGDLLPGGYLGVDLFFVLSGFLITSLLIREATVTGRINLKNFWLRRVRRIFPAAVTVLLLTSSIVGLRGGDLAVGLGKQFLSSLVFANNWVQIAGSHSYFADSGIEVFAHYWSLSVEEQFYVVWPLLVGLLIVVLHRKRLLAGLTVVLGIASAVAMGLMYDPTVDPTRIYYGTDTHAFGLLIGAALSLAITNTRSATGDSWPKRRLAFSGLAGAAALVGLCFAFFTLHDVSAQAYRGGIVAANLAGALVLLSVVRESGPVSWLFRLPFMRYLGERSFSIYLWHWPIIKVMEDMSLGWNQWVLAGVATALTLVASEVSYRYIETPFRRKGIVKTFRDLSKARATVALLAVLIAIALTIVGARNAPTKTKLEADLEQLAAIQAEAAAQAEAEKAAELEKLSKRKMPTGDKITAVGDSVMLASYEALMAEFPGIYVDGEVSRHYTAAIPILQSMEANGTLDQFVVLGFGTNGAMFDGQLDQILQIIGPDRIVVFTLPYGDREWMPPARQELYDAAHSYDNVYIADWCNAARTNPSLLREDDVHPSPEGAAVYAQAIRAAFQQWVDGKKVVPTGCYN